MKDQSFHNNAGKLLDDYLMSQRFRLPNSANA